MPDIEARTAFPEILKTYMKQSGMNQTDLAKQIHVSKQTVSDWLSGKKFPRVDRMQMLANLFGVLMSDMYKPSRHNPVSEHSENHLIEITDEEDHLLKLFRGANNQAKFDAIDLLAKHQKKDIDQSAI